MFWVLLHRIKNYFYYKIYSKSIYSIHSPFLYEFIKQCFDKKNRYYCFDELKNIRKKLKSDYTTIDYENIGSSYAKLNNCSTTVSKIAKTSVSPSKYSELYFRIITYMNAQNILELGTSLGLNTLYLSKATQSKVISIEGQKNIYTYAKQLLETHSAQNICLINKKFDDALPDIIENNTFDFVLIDGNHTYEATMKYFNLLKHKMAEKSVIVIDDIYWSKDMTRAWKEIIQDKSIQISLDLYRCGIIIFNQDIKTQYSYIIRY